VQYVLFAICSFAGGEDLEEDLEECVELEISYTIIFTINI
jgi:hypothetical protein